MEKLMELIAEQLHVEVSEVKTDAKFKEDLHADSLDLFELVMALEEKYEVECYAGKLYRDRQCAFFCSECDRCRYRTYQLSRGSFRGKYKPQDPDDSKYRRKNHRWLE